MRLYRTSHTHRSHRGAWPFVGLALSSVLLGGCSTVGGWIGIGKANPANESFKASFRAGVAAFQAGDYAAADRHFLAATRAGQTAKNAEWVASATALRGEAALARGDYARAAATVQSVNASGGNYQTWFVAGRAELGLGDVRKARDAFDRAAQESAPAERLTVAGDYLRFCDGVLAWQEGDVAGAHRHFGGVRDARLKGVIVEQFGESEPIGQRPSDRSSPTARR